MGLLPLLQSDPLAFVLVVLVLLISLALHEWGHAITALWMGDSTAKDQGRVTLNPIKHLDLIGSIMILLVGFGWAKPVPIYPPQNLHLLHSLHKPAFPLTSSGGGCQRPRA